MATKKDFLLRLRNRDTPTGVTRGTLSRLAKRMGLSETDLIHTALADYARTHLPQYEPDDGPLSDAQRAAIRSAVRKSHGRAWIVESLFDNNPTEGPGERNT